MGDESRTPDTLASGLLCGVGSDNCYCSTPALVYSSKVASDMPNISVSTYLLCSPKSGAGATTGLDFSSRKPESLKSYSPSCGCWTGMKCPRWLNCGSFNWSSQSATTADLTPAF